MVGLDVRTGKARVSTLNPEWLKVRDATVSKTTATTDKMAAALIPTSFKARSISSITAYDVGKWLVSLRQVNQLSDGSMTRYREYLPSLFAWAIKDRRIDTNPVAMAQAPTAHDEMSDMKPLSEADLERVVAKIAESNPHYARIIYILGWIGTRWSEARAQTETYAVKTTNGRRARHVPMPDRVAAVVQVLMAGKEPVDLLFIGVSCGMLWCHCMVETIDWPEVSRGRRLHDLRHTVACIWRRCQPGWGS